MGRVLSEGIDLFSLNGGTYLQAAAGTDAINKNDLLVLGGALTGLYPVQTSDYAAVSNAGSSPVALTTVSTYGSQFETRNRCVVDANNSDIFIADTYLTGPVGCKIWKRLIRSRKFRKST